MVQKTKKKKSADIEKERIFKGLSQLLLADGLTVRREELKRGPGWKASSGSCRKLDENLIFIDRKTPIEEQIAFLVQELTGAGIEITDTKLEILPEEIREAVSAIIPVALKA